MKKTKKIRNTNSAPMQDQNELQALLDVGKALSSEHETEKILDMILDEAIANTQSDGGSIYLVEKVPQDSLGGARPKFSHKLKFHKSLNKSLHYIKENNTFMDINNSSIAGYVALTTESVTIKDCYNLPKEAPYSFNYEFDKMYNYNTKSVLAVPIKTNKGRVVGVVQLVNKTKTYRRQTDPKSKKILPVSMENVISYSSHDVRLMEAFASHAAVALENAKLTKDIEKLFDSFVKASVTAIESRDPSTSGHSDRVADLTCGLAEKVDAAKLGTYKDITFSLQQMKELRYAALLHDFGKIGVKEDVLLKAKKLYPYELEVIMQRLDSIRFKNEVTVWRDIAEQTTALVGELKDLNEKPHVCANVTCAHAIHKVEDQKTALGQALWKVDGFNRKVEQIREAIIRANESQVLQGDLNIVELVQFIETLSTNLNRTIILPGEKERLLIPRGTLSAEERREIESHVSHTFTFLYQIAWIDDLGGVPEIAHAHHEKLDGTGYPRGLKADQIPIQSRMMTVCDIYDALTAMDRAYKKSVSDTRALDILKLEVKEGKLDKNLVDLFIESGVYKIVKDYKKKTAA
jgi:HD-GYP domain-containing protein (c-di-GMP phosphodiesterase class II)